MRFTPVCAGLALSCAIAGVSVGGTQAQQLTNSMTCAQAIAVFAAQGRVVTRTWSGAVLPIYGGVPAAKRRSLMCFRDRAVRPMSVITRDKKRCTIGYKC
ncbi:MAG: hypothetical protein NXI27_00555 [Alphaproteobacteria bacterium]|nr:hypothetical protein [Alphaproteobacteria bacterium]